MNVFDKKSTDNNSPFIHCSRKFVLQNADLPSMVNVFTFEKDDSPFKNLNE
jgi:hypothetical protein